MEKLIPASIANKRTNENIFAHVNEEIKQINKLIEKAIADKKFVTYWNDYLSDETIEILKENGYKVEAIYDQRDGSTINISWG